MPEAAEAALFIRSMKRSSAGGWMLGILNSHIATVCRLQGGKYGFPWVSASQLPFLARIAGIGHWSRQVGSLVGQCGRAGSSRRGVWGVIGPRPVAQGRVTLSPMPRKLSPMPRELVLGLGISFALSGFQTSLGKVDFDLASRDAFELPC